MVESEVREMAGGKYLLDGYQTVYDPKIFNSNGKGYSLQYHQKSHKNEYVIKNIEEGCCYLYRNGLLEMIWKEEKGSRTGDFVSLENGVISFIQDTNNLMNSNRWMRIINNARGELLELWEGNVVTYRGGFNENYKRDGIGIVYDRESGKEEYEGVLERDNCIQILKVFEGDEMIELFDNGNNVDVANQIPVYIGGWKVDENGEYIRNGIGYLIDKDRRIAVAEVVYENGIEVKQKELFDGWYQSLFKIKTNPYCSPIPYPYNGSSVINGKQLTIEKSRELRDMGWSVRDLTISSNSCNDIDSLNLKHCVLLKSLSVGDSCFENVSIFNIDGLKMLQSIKIGRNSFTRKKYEWGVNRSRSFHVLNCISLQSIDIGRWSFSDFAGAFELKNLPSLTKLKIGEIGYDSKNFFWLSFIVKDLPKLQYLELGDEAFHRSETIVISNLPDLDSIKLGKETLWGDDSELSSLEMKDLPKLSMINSKGGSFYWPHSLSLSNVPSLKKVSLPDAFHKVFETRFNGISPLLDNLIKYEKR